MLNTVKEHSPEAIAKKAQEMADGFLKKSKDKTLTIGIIGLGYVGLPLAEAYNKQGYNVVGYDIDPRKVEIINNGDVLLKHMDKTRMETLRDSGLLSATTDIAALKEADALLICVPTPLNAHREPDLSYVKKTTVELAKILHPGQIVILESTTYPGTSEEVILPLLEAGSGLKAGLEFAVAYSPEREDPGNPNFETSTIPKVVGANTPAEMEMAVATYNIITTPVPVSNMRTAEAVKLSENIFRLINIALVNELKTVYAPMGIDVWEVIDAAKTKPFGFMPFYPGPGLGGHCIPIDPFYLTWKAREHGVSTRFIELAGDVIAQMPKYVIERISEAMSTHLKKPLAGSRILLVGLSYKKNVDDMRESPTLHLIDQLRQRGADVQYHDPYIAKVPMTRDHPEYHGMQSVPLTKEGVAGFDCAVIATDHDNVDYDLIVREMDLIIDTRNATARVTGLPKDHVIKS